MAIVHAFNTAGLVMALAGATPVFGSAAGGGQPEVATLHAIHVDVSSITERLNEAMGLRHSRLVRFDAEVERGIPMRIAIELDGAAYALDLAPYSVRAADYRVFHSDASGVLRPVEPGPVNTFRGVAVEDPASVVAGGVLDGGLYGRILLGDDREHWIQPVPAFVEDRAEGLHVIYRASDVAPRDAGRSLAVGGAAPRLAEVAGAPTRRSPLAGVFDEAELAIDADNTYFVKWGEKTEDRINLIIGVMNLQYERDVAITHFITAIVVRTEPVYSNTSNAQTLLAEFRGRWNNNHDDIQRDAAQLSTCRAMNGIVTISTLATLCDISNAYSLVRNDFEPEPIFECSTDRCARALGHNWGASACNCIGYTMHPVIQCANQFHPEFTIPTIEAFRDSRGCLSTPLNDFCDKAEPVGDGSFEYTTLQSTTDGAAILPAECDDGAGPFMRNDVWFLYTAPCDGTATASLCDADHDNRVVVYEDVTCPGDVIIGCADNRCGEEGTRAEVTFAVTQGRQYLIRIGSSSAVDVGSGTLVLSCGDGSCPADLDGSGDVGFGDLLQLLAAWGPYKPCPPLAPEDLDEDCQVGFNDLLALLAAWGPCE